MDQKKIKALLADYYEGRTSREDEDALVNYFLNTQVPAELEVDRLLFMSISESAREEIPDGQFDEKLFAAIENQGLKNDRKRSITKLLITASGIAAGILIFIGSYFFLIEKQIEDRFLVTEEHAIIDETQIAYIEARDALLLVSEVMNKGTGQLVALSKMTDATRELTMINKFSKGANNLQTIGKFDETISEIRRTNE
jgi:hypothetical protein